MRKIIISLFSIGILVSANDCYILNENIIGTINENLLDSMKDQEKQKEAIKNYNAVVIPKGTKFCNTEKSNWTHYRKQVILENNTKYWVNDTLKAEIIN